MRPYSLREVAEAVGGKILSDNHDKILTSAATDSREAKEGCLFFALKGAKMDGHKFVKNAIDGGCSGVVISKSEPAAELRTEIESKQVGVVLVDDTLKALHDLARYHLSKLPIKYKIGVTGSVGKTSTRDFIFGVSSMRYKTGKSLKNLNTNTGMPLSILEFSEDTEVAVLEMGMDKLGEIHELAEIVRPDISVITNIGVPHIDTLGSLENILRAKMEITDFFDRASTLVYNSDCDLLQDREQFGDYNLVAVGGEESADFTVTDICDYGTRGTEYKMTHKGKTYEVSLPLPGAHNAVNSTLAVAVGSLIGIGVEDAIAGLEKVSLTGKRLEIISHEGVTIINDTYNAGPQSMKSALNTLVNTEGDRKIAIMGDMLGLGLEEAEYHREIGAYACEAKVDMVISVGTLAKYYDYGILDEEGSDVGVVEHIYFADKQSLIPELKSIIKRGDVVLVKASRAMAMEEITEKIMNL